MEEEEDQGKEKVQGKSIKDSIIYTCKGWGGRGESGEGKGSG